MEGKLIRCEEAKAAYAYILQWKSSLRGILGKWCSLKYKPSFSKVLSLFCLLAKPKFGTGKLKLSFVTKKLKKIQIVPAQNRCLMIIKLLIKEN